MVLDTGQNFPFDVSRHRERVRVIQDMAGQCLTVDITLLEGRNCARIEL